MSTPREMLAETPYEVVKVKAVLTPLLVRLQIPIEVKEITPLGRVKAIDGVRLIRFYCLPSAGDIIEFKDSQWRVLGLYHEVRPSGSTLKDKLPIVMTEFISIGSAHA